jgi:hypothetical protein
MLQPLSDTVRIDAADLDQGRGSSPDLLMRAHCWPEVVEMSELACWLVEEVGES